MKTSFDTDAIIYQLLKQSAVHNAISGGIYVGDDRPNDSADEDIVVNSISLMQDFLPQIGTSNINIYVPDAVRSINGKQQLQANRTRLKAIAELVMATIRSANITGLKMQVSSQYTLEEPSIKQHYVNIRIEWNIQID